MKVLRTCRVFPEPFPHTGNWYSSGTWKWNGCGAFRSWNSAKRQKAVYRVEVLQSTRPREARPAVRELKQAERGFNPRARARRDSDSNHSGPACTSFNPRARARRDLGRGLFIPSVVKFQSTRPREARLSARTGAAQYMGFNPRARARRDVSHSDSTEIAAVSIHAPARGATGGVPVYLQQHRGFNPRARAWRDHIMPGLAHPVSVVSIHAPARGAT